MSTMWQSCVVTHLQPHTICCCRKLNIAVAFQELVAEVSVDSLLASAGHIDEAHEDGTGQVMTKQKMEEIVGRYPTSALFSIRC